MSAVVRERPRGLQRVLVGYGVTFAALACGLPAVVVGVVAANNCTAEGFRCLGRLIYGYLAAVLMAAVALLLIARRFRLGSVFALLTIALVVVPLLLGDGSLSAGTAFLAPGLAAWVSEPKPSPGEINPLAPPALDPSPLRTWGPRIGAIVLLSILIPALGRVF